MHGVIVIDNSNSEDYMCQGNSNNLKTEVIIIVINRQSSNSISNINIQSHNSNTDLVRNSNLMNL